MTPLNPHKRCSVRDIVAETVQKWQMIIPGQKILVAVSGGPDSMALLHLLKELATPFEMALGVAHINHGLRGAASDADEQFTATMAREMECPFHAKTVDVHRFQQKRHLSQEEAARILRYQFFDEIMTSTPYDRVATGHNADDNAELVLMNLIRGSGPLGLSGIPPMRNNRIIRPLIRLTRQEIKMYLDQQDIPYITDASNNNPVFLRNRIRHELIPLLRSSYNPAITEGVNRTARIMREEENWLALLAGKELENVTTRRSPDSLCLDRKKLADLHSALRSRIFRAAITQIKGNSRRISWSHIESIDTMDMGAASGKSLDLPGQIRIFFQDNDLIIQREVHPLREQPPVDTIIDHHGFEYCLDSPGTVRIKETGATVKIKRTVITDRKILSSSGENNAFFDINRVCFPITIRNIRKGDRFVPLGMDGTKKVKDFLADGKITRVERTAIPVLVSAGRIVWVAGKRIDHRARVRSMDGKVLSAQFIPSENGSHSE